MSWEAAENFLETLEVIAVNPENSLFEVTRNVQEETTMTSGPSKNFLTRSHDMKLMFVSFLMIISFYQNKRGGHTTLSSDSMVRIASKR